MDSACCKNHQENLQTYRCEHHQAVIPTNSSISDSSIAAQAYRNCDQEKSCQSNCFQSVTNSVIAIRRWTRLRTHDAVI